MNTNWLQENEVRSAAMAAVAATPVTDMHTHVYAPSFGTPTANATGKSDPAGLLLWGVDELLTYHYLVAEVYRVVPATKLPYEQFWKMSKRQQADHIWRELFVQRSPISEACRGVLTTLNKLGLDPYADGLEKVRKYFAEQTPTGYIDRVMQVANVDQIVMTNAIFDAPERARWVADHEVGRDERFKAVLRIDPMLRNWPAAAKVMRDLGYKANDDFDAASAAESRRFLKDWIGWMTAIYVAVSLPPEFRYPAAGTPLEAIGQQVLDEVILPVCAELKLPFAMMIGATWRVNPALGDAGDMVGRSDVSSVVRLCSKYPQNKFFVTMLARENQHEMCVAARKFGNLMPFGCWWFLNNPSLITEMTRMRMELLGTSFIPQHSDARVLDQLVYKWEHSRRLIGEVLGEKYADMIRAGGRVNRQQIERDARLLLRDNFNEFLQR